MLKLKTKNKRFFVRSMILALLLISSTYGFAAGRCRVESPYYFSEFSPSSWKIENELNYEEVYKNYEYFEIFFNAGCDEITVKQYVQGQIGSVEKYKLNSDGSLSKMEHAKGKIN